MERAAASIEPGPIKLVGRQEKQEEVVDLGSAKVVVCVGRGIQNKQNLGKAQEYAARIGGETACTRPIAEGEGWMAHSRYLGVSGAVVKPDVYIGLGPCRARCSTPWAWRNRSSWWPSTRTRTLRS